MPPEEEEWPLPLEEDDAEALMAELGDLAARACSRSCAGDDASDGVKGEGRGCRDAALRRTNPSRADGQKGRESLLDAGAARTCLLTATSLSLRRSTSSLRSLADQPPGKR